MSPQEEIGLEQDYPDHPDHSQIEANHLFIFWDLNQTFDDQMSDSRLQIQQEIEQFFKMCQPKAQQQFEEIQKVYSDLGKNYFKLTEKIKESPIKNKSEVLLNLLEVFIKVGNDLALLLKKKREEQQIQISSNKYKESSKCQNWQENENKSQKKFLEKVANLKPDYPKGVRKMPILKLSR